MPGRSWQLSFRPLAFREKFHRLIGPIYLGLSAPIGRPRDINAEARGQRLADVEIGGQRSRGQRQGQESKSGGSGSQDQDLS